MTRHSLFSCLENILKFRKDFFFSYTFLFQGHLGRFYEIHDDARLLRILINKEYIGIL